LGRQSRERKQRIQAGLEKPIGKSEILFCKYCRKSIELVEAREHIKKCWGYQIKDIEPIPNEPVNANGNPIKLLEELGL
jgi:hypothetical protein